MARITIIESESNKRMNVCILLGGEPFFHFCVFFLCDGSRGGCSDELGCEFDEFFVVNLADFRDDLCVRVSWVCDGVVCE